MHVIWNAFPTCNILWLVLADFWEIAYHISCNILHKTFTPLSSERRGGWGLSKHELTIALTVENFILPVNFKSDIYISYYIQHRDFILHLTYTLDITYYTYMSSYIWLVEILESLASHFIFHLWIYYIYWRCAEFWQFHIPFACTCHITFYIYISFDTLHIHVILYYILHIHVLLHIHYIYIALTYYIYLAFTYYIYTVVDWRGR